MFVPRALRLKGVKETLKRKPGKPQGSRTTDASSPSDNPPEEAIQKTNDTSAALTSTSPSEENRDEQAGAKTSRPATPSASPEYLAQLLAGIELLFTDYAHQNSSSVQWLQSHYRTLSTQEENYIHLTAILSHPTIATLKPQATQPLLRHAFQELPSQTLELSENGFYVRRRPSTYPAPFVPANSFDVVNDDGLSFWDQRTIYVEPHIRHMCKTPAKVAHWLKEHGQLRAKWLPVQAVHTLYNSCAFVVLSGNVMHEDQWRKWRVTEKPENWRVMTKVENVRRTEEYVALREASLAEVKAKRRSSRSIGLGDALGAVAGDTATGEDGEGQQAARKRVGDEDLPDRTAKRRA
ncbi:hypothetical protein BU23DRAFT_550337 [Bimuria novae-zelandiae CBS 107.79]|uniref:Uncharacterized protein n=1 Tax=Bimuria novae-zelandiae CBS 107.79 TaxID=1447943 RepID=A0A6A5VLT7_9PLEO|nr:hypothetical protein BU23DRAFT_550337 [Bimuria novae-zelandiae CBS 107.79]